MIEFVTCPKIIKKTFIIRNSAKDKKINRSGVRYHNDPIAFIPQVLR